MGVNPDAWNTFLASLDRPADGRLESQYARFREFVGQLPECDRVPLLLHAYDRYRESSAVCRDNLDRFESACYSVLISTILKTRLRPTEDQALAILHKSYHQCGHGSDVDPPLEFAERAFQGRPYTAELFDAVRAYYETLRGTRATVAQNIKRKLTWILWHDPRNISKTCWSGRIQAAIHGMEPNRRFAWEWLLRNTTAKAGAGAGKAWSKEGRKRLSHVGEDEFLRRLDEWFVFPESGVKLSSPGSCILRLLVWYGSLVDPQRSLPILLRLSRVAWGKREPVGKAISALAWLLLQNDGNKYLREIELLCGRWAGECTEVGRLQEVYFPREATVRQEAERAEREKHRAIFDATMAGIATQLESIAKQPGMARLGQIVTAFNAVRSKD